jgi:hypothetical protein
VTDGDELRPAPRTEEAFAWLNVFQDDSVETSMRDMARRVRTLAPECVALSVSLTRRGWTFTYQADRLAAALMDAMTYLVGDSRPDAGAHLGITSTLSLPVMEAHEVVDVVNLYGATPDAFAGRQTDLAEACGAWAGGAITNADLGFTTRIRAAVTPDRLLDQADIDIATGIIAELHGFSADEAGDRLRAAALRAGVSDTEFAKFVIDSFGADLES